MRKDWRLIACFSGPADGRRVRALSEYNFELTNEISQNVVIPLAHS